MGNQPSEETVQAFKCIWQEAARINSKWQILQRVFAERNIPLLQKTDPLFFIFCQEGMARDTLMGICRLTDPERQGRKGKYENMTIERLVRLAKADGLPGADGLAGKLSWLKKCASVREIRDARNKRAGHWDAETALAWLASPEPKAGFGPHHLRAAVTLVNDLVNEAAKVLRQHSRPLGPDSGSPDAGQKLIEALEKAASLEEAIRAIEAAKEQPELRTITPARSKDQPKP